MVREDEGFGHFLDKEYSISALLCFTHLLIYCIDLFVFVFVFLKGYGTLIGRG